MKGNTFKKTLSIEVSGFEVLYLLVLEITKQSRTC